MDFRLNDSRVFDVFSPSSDPDFAAAAAFWGMPMTFGRRLAETRNARGITQAELARALGVSRGAVSQWESGKNDPDFENAQKAANYLAVDFAWLITGETMAGGGTYQPAVLDRVRPVPVLTKKTALDWPPQAGETANAEDYVIARRDLGPDAFALKVESTAMLPDFQPGDVIIVDPAAEPQAGLPVIAAVPGQKAAVLRIYTITGWDKANRPNVDLVALNGAWPNFQMTDKGRVIGTVVEHRSQPRPRSFTR
jgi:transcriptional regulator with XRE-family HTH domain